MSEAPVHWSVEELLQRLEPLLPGLSVEVVARASSTNSSLLERARVEPERASDRADAQVGHSSEGALFGKRAADVAPCLLVAEHQSGGRGRLGRSWQSARGASLTFSLALPLRRGDWSGLSLAVGVALAEALDPAPAPGAPRIGLKWPNDLWLMDSATCGRKLGGILIESVAAHTTRLAVIGVGLNVLPLDVPGASSGFACTQEFDPGTSAPAVLQRIARPLVSAVLLFERAGFGAFEQRFATRDVLCHRAVCTTQADVPEGVAQGVTSEGALLVRTRAGLQCVASGEVSVRLNPLAAPAQEPSC